MIHGELITFYENIKLKNGRLFAIDYGIKFVGLAVTDEERILASPYEVIPNNKQLIAGIVDVIQSLNVSGVVVGWPINTFGNVHKIGDDILLLCGSIYKKNPIDILLWDERMSTRIAVNSIFGLGYDKNGEYPLSKNKGIKRMTKGRNDHLAAQHILTEVILSIQNLQK